MPINDLTKPNEQPLPFSLLAAPNQAAQRSAGRAIDAVGAATNYRAELSRFLDRSARETRAPALSSRPKPEVTPTSSITTRMRDEAASPAQTTALSARPAPRSTERAATKSGEATDRSDSVARPAPTQTDRTDNTRDATPVTVETRERPAASEFNLEADALTLPYDASVEETLIPPASLALLTRNRADVDDAAISVAANAASTIDDTPVKPPIGFLNALESREQSKAPIVPATLTTEVLSIDETRELPVLTEAQPLTTQVHIDVPAPTETVETTFSQQQPGQQTENASPTFSSTPLDESKLSDASLIPSIQAGRSSGKQDQPASQPVINPTSVTTESTASQVEVVQETSRPAPIDDATPAVPVTAENVPEKSRTTSALAATIPSAQTPGSLSDEQPESERPDPLPQTENFQTQDAIPDATAENSQVIAPQSESGSANDNQQESSPQESQPQQTVPTPIDSNVTPADVSRHSALAAATTDNSATQKPEKDRNVDANVTPVSVQSSEGEPIPQTEQPRLQSVVDASSQATETNTVPAEPAPARSADHRSRNEGHLEQRDEGDGVPAANSASQQASSFASASGVASASVAWSAREPAVAAQTVSSSETPDIAAATDVVTRTGGPTATANQESIPLDGPLRDSATTQTTKTAAKPVVTNAQAEQLVDRVAGTIRQAQQTNAPLRIRLNPPELGVLQVDVSMKEGVLTARLEVHTASAQQALTEHVSQLREALQGHGPQLERIDVQIVRTDQSEGRSESEQQQQQQQQQGQQQQQNREQNSGNRQQHRQSAQSDTNEPEAEDTSTSDAPLQQGANDDQLNISV